MRKSYLILIALIALSVSGFAQSQNVILAAVTNDYVTNTTTANLAAAEPGGNTLSNNRGKIVARTILPRIYANPAAMKVFFENNKVNTPFYFDNENANLIGLEIGVLNLEFTNSSSEGNTLLSMNHAKSFFRTTADKPLAILVQCNTAISPDLLFSLYRMDVNGERREIHLPADMYLTKNSDDASIPFKCLKLTNKIYLITPVAALENGEYCLVNRLSYMNYKRTTGIKANAFAFGID